MKSRIRSLLPVSLALSIVAAPLPAQVPDESDIPDGVQAALSAPVWYLHYSFEIKLSGPMNELIERTTTGSMMLGLRTQSPFFSAQEAAARAMKAAAQGSSEADAFFTNYANWLSGVNPDEEKTDEENEAEMFRVRFENLKAHHVYHWQYSNPADHLGGSSRGFASGSGTVLYGDDIAALELDAAGRRFKLHLAPGFRDSEQTSKAVTGAREEGIGSIHYKRTPIETALYPDHLILDTIEPALGEFYEGTIPEKGGNLSYSSIRTITSGFLRGTLAIEFVLSPEPPEPVELIIEPPGNYEDWRPIAGENEETAGDLVPVKVHYQKQGGGVPKTKATQFIYRLADTSQEKGVCMNWPLRPAASQPRDLQFEPARNLELTIGDKERQSAMQDSEGGRIMTEGEVVISCFDYGAWSTFTAEAKLEDGRTILATVSGSQLEYLKLPKRKDGSHIAEVFFKENGIGDLPDDDDSENDPVGDGFKGDGLTLYEEYRGFKHGDGWVTCDPKVKDVFVLNLMRGMNQVSRGIDLFTIVTGLNVHPLLREYQTDAEHCINFNHTDAPHVVDQHVIRIIAGKRLSEGATGAGVEKVGTPKTARAIRMPPDWQEFRTVGGRIYHYFAKAVAHEMLHDCNVYHHGENDETVEWKYVAGPPAHVVESGYGPIVIMTESGNTIDPAAGFPDPAKQDTIAMELGVDHGQCSGEENCLMRYETADIYRSKADPRIRYLSPGETTGMGLCVGVAGTGVNSPNHRPQSRYDSAAPPGGDILAQRGNCKFQLRVNDLGEEPKR